MTALIGALRVSLSADTANFAEGMRRAQVQAAASGNAISRSLGTIKSGLVALTTGLSLGLLADVVKKALDYAGSIEEVSRTLGVTTAQLQEYRYAASQTGVAQDQLETGLRKLNQTMGQAEAGGKAQAKAFGAIGISLDDLKGKSAGDVFKLVADGLQKVTDRAQRAAIEVALFGKSGAQLDNLLSGGSAQIDALSDAARTLGIVLSDAQLQNAEETAHKLDALKTVLEASIASAVTQNADAILGLARTIETLVGLLPGALRSYRAFVAGMELAGGALKAYDPTNSAQGRSEGRVQMVDAQIQLADLRRQQAGGSSLADRAAKFRQAIGADPKPAAPGSDIPKFLGSGGGGSRIPRTRHVSAGGGAKPVDRSDDIEFQFAQEERRADMDILQARQDLSHDAGDRAEIELQMLALDKQGRDAEIDHKVDQAKRDLADRTITQATFNEITAQAAILKAKGDQADKLKAQAILDDRDRQLVQDQLDIDSHWLDIKQDMLKKQEDLATTQAERRKIELQLLDYAYDEKKRAIEAAIRNAQNDKDKEIAEQDLQTLNANYSLDRQGVMRQTQGPLAAYAQSIPQSAKEIGEALESEAVKGLSDFNDQLADAIVNAKSLKDVFHNVAASILQDLIKIALQEAEMAIFKQVLGAVGSIGGGFGGSAGAAASGVGSTASGAGSALSGLQGFATGGSFSILGKQGSDRNVLSLNGLPIARVSHGERLSIGNDNQPPSMSPPVSLTMHNDFSGVDPASVARVEAKLDQMQVEFPARVVATMADAKSRFMWRG